MTITNHTLSLMVASLRFTYDNSITDDNGDKSTANVILVRSLEIFLCQNMLEELEEILNRYDSLQEFLIADHDRKFVDKDTGKNWWCDIMIANRYNKDERREKKMFWSLKPNVSYKEPLFIMCPFQKSFSDIAEELTNQMYKSIVLI